MFNKSSSVEVPSVGDSRLEILHGGVGGDVELGARTSKHIFVFAFDPLVSNSLSYLCIASFLLPYHSYHIACVALHLSYYCISIICLACLCVCLTCT